MKQREIWLVNLNPGRGSEQKGVRPVLVISGDAMNDNLGICIVCPVSSKIKGYKGCMVLNKDKHNGLDTDSEVITFQIRAVSGERFLRRIGIISKDQLKIINNGLMEILKY